MLRPRPHQLRAPEGRKDVQVTRGLGIGALRPGGVETQGRACRGDWMGSV